MDCPQCNGKLEFVYGDYGTGVFAPDGGQEVRYEEGLYCERCNQHYDESDLEAEPERDAEIMAVR